MRLTLKVKVILISLTVCILSVTFLSLYSTVRFARSFREREDINNQQILQQLAFNIDAYLEEVYRLTQVPYYYPSILDELSKPPLVGGMEWLQKKRTIEDFLASALIYPRYDIQRVWIIGDEAYVSERSYSLLPSYEEQIHSDWYKQAVESTNTVVVLPNEQPHSGYSSGSYFSLVSAIRDIQENTKVLGVIKVDANFFRLQQLCNEINMGNEGGVALFSQTGNIVYTNIASPLEGSLSLSNLSAKEASKNGLLLNTIELEHFGWRLVGVNSLDEIQQEVNNINYVTLAVAFIILVVTALLLYGLMSRFLRPFYDVIMLMNRIRGGDLTVRYQSARTDEVGELGRTLNTMLDNLDAEFKKNSELDQKIYRAHLFQREAQIQLLYSQIRPHFIYNTLNMISILVQSGNLNGAVENINRLSLILRGIAYINKDIPLKTELSLIDAFLSIQKTRFGDRVEYQIQVSPALDDLIVPALTLQPIVENAVNYGGGRKNQPISIKIFSEITPQNILLIVEDNGCGISQESLEQLLEKINQKHNGSPQLVYDLSKESGLGLSNVHARIRMRFGKEYGIRIQSTVGAGTRVEVMLPPGKALRDDREEGVM